MRRGAASPKRTDERRPERHSLAPHRAAKPQSRLSGEIIMSRKFLNLTLIIALSLTVALAQQPSSSSPSVDRIRQVITYLASDPLEGRRTGTPGANDAARYIAEEMNRFGRSEEHTSELQSRGHL